MKAEVNKRLKECTQVLENLGPKRDTPVEQSKFLIDMSTRFQAIVSHALDAKYGVDDAFSMHPPLKIATRIISRNEKLAEDFTWYGQTYLFEEFDADPENNFEPPTSKHMQPGSMRKKKPPKGSEWQAPAILGHEDFPAAVPAPSMEGEPSPNNNGLDAVYTPPTKIKTGCETRTIIASDDISDMLHNNERIDAPRPSGIAQWLTDIYQHSRGFELASFDPCLISTTMKAQSRNWDSLALGYISDVVALTHAFITTLLQLICPDSRVRENLHSMLVDHLNERYRKAFDQVHFILQVERSGVPATMNHYFINNLEKW